MVDVLLGAAVHESVLCTSEMTMPEPHGLLSGRSCHQPMRTPNLIAYVVALAQFDNDLTVSCTFCFCDNVCRLNPKIIRLV